MTQWKNNLDLPNDEPMLIVRPCYTHMCWKVRPAAKLLSVLLYHARNEQGDTFTIGRTQEEMADHDMCEEITCKTLADTAIPALVLFGFIDIDMSTRTFQYTLHLDRAREAIAAYKESPASLEKLLKSYVTLSLEKLLIQDWSLEKVLIVLRRTSNDDKKKFLRLLELVLMILRKSSQATRGRKRSAEVTLEAIFEETENLESNRDITENKRDSFDNSAHASLSENDLRTFSYSNGVTTHPDTSTSEHTQGEDHEQSLPVTHRASDMGRNHHRDSGSVNAPGEQEEIAVSGSQLTTRNLEDDDPEKTVPRISVVSLNGVTHHDRTPATAYPTPVLGLDWAVDVPVSSGGSNGTQDRQDTLQAGHVSPLQVQQEQETAQVQVTPSSQEPRASSLPLAVASPVEVGSQGDTRPMAITQPNSVPSADSPSSHPPQQATHAPVASVPPDREQRGAGEIQEVYDTPEAWETAQKAFLEALRQEWGNLSKPEKTKRGGRWDTYKKQQWDAWKVSHSKPKDEALDEACREIYHKIATEWRGYEWDSGKAVMNERTFIRNFCLKYRRDHPDTVVFFGQIIEHMTTKTFKWSQESYRYKWSASDVYHETDAILQLWKNPPKPNGKPAYNGNSNGKGHLTTVPRTSLDVPTFTAADYDRLRSMPV